MPTAIRRAAAGDAAAAAAITSAAYRPYIERIGREPAPMSADFGALIAAGDVWVATDHDRVVGVLVLRVQETALLLESVAVDPAHQGHGIGRSLIDHAERVARDAGLGSVDLYTNAHMTENLRLYPSLGYDVVDRRREDGFDRVFFRKSVAPGG
ncbi:MAG TPA: GNAT family N-acetyltransferase [Gaiellales bacterium]|nr:GNAT family N-acetyltransferase [Gaiellales bacterium]